MSKIIIKAPKQGKHIIQTQADVKYDVLIKDKFIKSKDFEIETKKKGKDLVLEIKNETGDFESVVIFVDFYANDCEIDIPVIDDYIFNVFGIEGNDLVLDYKNSIINIAVIESNDLILDYKNSIINIAVEETQPLILLPLFFLGGGGGSPSPVKPSLPPIKEVYDPNDDPNYLPSLPLGGKPNVSDYSIDRDLGNVEESVREKFNTARDASTPVIYYTDRYNVEFASIYNGTPTWHPSHSRFVIRSDVGTNGIDFIIRTSGSIDAKGGNDRIWAGNYTNLLVKGGSGNDHINGQKGVNGVEGNDGNDIIFSGSGVTDNVWGDNSDGTGGWYDFYNIRGLKTNVIIHDFEPDKDTLVIELRNRDPALGATNLTELLETNDRNGDDLILYRNADHTYGKIILKGFGNTGANSGIGFSPLADVLKADDEANTFTYLRNQIRNDVIKNFDVTEDKIDITNVVNNPDGTTDLKRLAVFEQETSDGEINTVITLDTDLDGVFDPLKDTSIILAEISGLDGNTLINNGVIKINNAPIVATPIADKVILENQPFSKSVKDNFVDPDNNLLIYTAALANGNPLLNWLDFDPTTLIISGTTPSVATDEIIRVVITATDSSGSEVNDEFAIEVKETTLPTPPPVSSGNNPTPGTTPIFVNGTSSNDIMHGTIHDDGINGKDGDDEVYGYDGNDRMWGKDGDDIMHGGDGDDEMYGGNGDDIMHGGDGDDEMYGGNGDDEMYGGNGDDWMHSGSGDDIFYYEYQQTGNDEIADFTSRDKIDLTHVLNTTSDSIDLSELVKISNDDGTNTTISIDTNLDGIYDNNDTTVTLLGISGFELQHMIDSGWIDYSPI